MGGWVRGGGEGWGVLLALSMISRGTSDDPRAKLCRKKRRKKGTGEREEMEREERGKRGEKKRHR